MSPATEIADYLAQRGIGQRGGSSDWSIHVSREPTAPHEVVTLYDTAGGPPISEDIGLRQHGLQVRVRSTLYEDGYAVQEQIFNELVQLYAAQTGGTIERNIGSHRYIGIWATGDILAIGRDDNDRFLFTANYLIHRQPSGDST